MIGRRGFLKAGTAGLLAGAAGLTSPVLARDLPRTPGSSLENLGRGLKGRLVLPDDPAYAYAAMPNNARWSGVRPKAIAACVDADDVRACILWARDNNQPFAIRSGGHSYAGFSTTEGLLIDLKPMNGVSLDLKNGTATVQGGANNDDTAGALRVAPFAVPSGRCPTVGVGGLVLGGGWGFSATRSGLTCDSLLSTDVVLADGRRITASETQSPDLFWAARGAGGGNFGVHTSFTFRLRPVHDVVLFNIHWPPGRQVELMSLLQTIQIANATEMSTRTKVAPMAAGATPARDTLAAQTLGLYWGTESRLREILQPAFGLLTPRFAEINKMQFWTARDALTTDDPIGLYDIRSNYVGERLSDDGLEAMMQWMSKWPGGSRRQANMGVLFAIGGAVRKKRWDETAYVHRNSNFLCEMEASWSPLDAPETVERQRAWLSEYVADMQRFMLPQSYVNFPDRELKDWKSAYYGGNLKRLQSIKRQYDPDNLFRFQQSIPPSAA